MHASDAKVQILTDQLAALPPFRAVARNDLLSLARRGALRPMAAGELVVSFGERPTEVSIVLSGSLHHVGPDGKPGAVSARPGDCAGITSVFTRSGPAMRSLVAGPGTTCLVFESAWLSEQRGNNAVVALELASLGDLTRRMRASNLDAKRVLHNAAQDADPAALADRADGGGLMGRLRALFGGSR